MSDVRERIWIPKKRPEDEEGLSTQPASLGEIFLAGPVLSVFSPSFYRHAGKRSAFAALIFAVIFGLFVAAVQTVRVGADFGAARAEIDRAFASGEIPEVTIEGGIATVDAEQPFVAVDDGHSLVVLDTTGRYTGQELAEGGYQSGLILTRDAIYGVDDQGRYTEATFREINQVFPLPIRFNADFLKRFIDLAQAFVFFGLSVWHAVLRPIYIALLALFIWGAASLLQRGISFSTVMITGLFASVPALYAEYLFNRVDVNVFMQYTVMLIIIWTVALVAAAGTRREGDLLRGERPIRAWRALLGLPMLAVFALDYVYTWERGALIVWMTAALTAVWLAVVEFYISRRAALPKSPGKIASQE